MNEANQDATTIQAEDQPVTMEQMAAMTFTPLAPPFRRFPETISGWMDRARSEFPMFGFVEVILRHDDAALTEIVRKDPEAQVKLAEGFANVRERWEVGVDYLQKAELRLMVALARCDLAEQAAGGPDNGGLSGETVQ